MDVLVPIAGAEKVHACFRQVEDWAKQVCSTKERRIRKLSTPFALQVHCMIMKALISLKSDQQLLNSWLNCFRRSRVCTGWRRCTPQQQVQMHFRAPRPKLALHCLAVLDFAAQSDASQRNTWSWSPICIYQNALTDLG